MASPDVGFDQRMERVESLLQQIEQSADPAARATMQEIVQALMDLHGAGLARILELIPNPEDLARDDLVSSLLLLYDLHPTDLTTRVRAALDRLQPELAQRSAGAELAEIQDGRVVILISESAIHPLVEEAIIAAAPDAEAIEVKLADRPLNGRLSLPMSGGRS